jgi:hypothetical protein
MGCKPLNENNYMFVYIYRLCRFTNINKVYETEERFMHLRISKPEV